MNRMMQHTLTDQHKIHIVSIEGERIRAFVKYFARYFQAPTAADDGVDTSASTAGFSVVTVEGGLEVEVDSAGRIVSVGL